MDTTATVLMGPVVINYMIPITVNEVRKIGVFIKK